ncbi:MAG: ABC transporter permease [Pseudomonadales bacterium]
MIHPITFSIALRYASAGLGLEGGRRYVRFVSRASVAGIALGTAALIMVVSVMNGFDRELKMRLLNVTPHITVDSSVRPAGILKIKGVSGIFPYLSSEALLLDQQDGRLFRLQGLSREDPQIQLIRQALKKGRWWTSDDVNPIVIGESLAYQFGLNPGDAIQVALVEVSGRGDQVTPRVVSFLLTGTYALGAETDHRLAMTRFESLTTVLGTDPVQRINLDAPMLVGKVSAELEQVGIEVSGRWDFEFGDFFQAVKLEKIMMGFLLSMLIGLALISLSSGMKIVMLEKQSSSQILVALGLTPRANGQIFFFQGSIFAGLGISLGAFLGVSGALLLPTFMEIVQVLTGFSVVSGSYFSELPVDLRLFDTMMIIAAALLSSLAVIAMIVRSASQRSADFDLK